MKTISILRHAKSDWSDADLDDFDRPLNKRGEKDAPRMGKYLKSTGKLPGIIYSSPALRAKTTAEIVKETSGYPGDIEYMPEFYASESPEVYIDKIKRAPDNHDSIMVVGHNPTLENLLADLLSDHPVNIKFPTAGLACLNVEIESWKELKPGTAILYWMMIPKALPDC